MLDPVPKIYDLGDSAMTIEFGDSIDSDVNKTAVAVSRYLADNPFPGFIESSPAYASATVFYDPCAVHAAVGKDADIREFVQERLLSASSQAFGSLSDRNALIEVPALFGGESGPDLQTLSARFGVSEEEFIGIFTGREYRVFMLGFLPGFAYMGKVDERIAVPRRDTPRKRVPAGSIGIADEQTGIYPLDSPGGWQIIGRTKLQLFDPQAAAPFLFSPGDRVKFVPVL
ncbi:MAG: 5-oxoprolinase subunit PxpB [Acidobacteriota bacterium]|nr:MAG: 5-oxoprolinase subunit PxpB [Acidobacteriota bacterium]